MSLSDVFENCNLVRETIDCSLAGVRCCDFCYEASSVADDMPCVYKEGHLLAEEEENSGGIQPVALCDAAVVCFLGNVGIFSKIQLFDGPVLTLLLRTTVPVV